MARYKFSGGLLEPDSFKLFMDTHYTETVSPYTRTIMCSVVRFIKNIETIPDLVAHLVAAIPCRRNPWLAQEVVDEMEEAGYLEKIPEN